MSGLRQRSPARCRWRISLVRHIRKCREMNVSCIFFKKIDVFRLIKKKIIIIQNNSPLPYTALICARHCAVCLYLLSFQQHDDVDTIIILILMIKFRMVNSADVTQLINDRTRVWTRSVWHQSPFFLTISLECLSEGSLFKRQWKSTGDMGAGQ